MGEKKITPEFITMGPGGKMQVGINYPCWKNKYGVWFGSTDPNEPWEADIEKMFTDYDALHVRHFRIHTLSNLADYGTVSPLPGNSGLWQFHPPATIPFKYIDGLKRLLAIVKKCNVRVVLNLVDGLAFNRSDRKFGATDRYFIVADDVLRAKFMSDVVETLVVESKPFAEYIVAWEIMNEPLWAVADLSENPANQFGAVLSRDQIDTFLKDGLAIIEKHGFKSTVGHANPRELDDFPNGTLKQFHFYPTHLRGDLVKGFSTTGAFLGEISGAVAKTSVSIDLQDALFRSWPELAEKDCIDTRTAVFLRLKLLNQRGYRMAFIWPDHDQNADGTSKLSLEGRNGISDYNAI